MATIEANYGERELFNKMRPQLLISLGTKCCNCQIECGNNIIFHHIVPLSLGGKNIFSNIAPVCEKCDSLIHDINRANWKELQKIGIEKAKAQGKYKGRKRIKIDNNLFNELYTQLQSKTITKSQMAIKLQISRPTLDKRIEEYQTLKEGFITSVS